MDTLSARKKLLSLKGVGPKVADCILLFGLGKKDVFPVDVWIKRVYLREYKGNNDRKDIANVLTEKFGNLSGYIQQYLFYYYRENSIKSIDKE
jgi:3-methyladenine DNA glycosylase/8-oxoguanine DNA glycosylase